MQQMKAEKSKSATCIATMYTFKQMISKRHEPQSVVANFVRRLTEHRRQHFSHQSQSLLILFPQYGNEATRIARPA